MRFRGALIGFVVVSMTSLLLARAHPFGDAGLYAAAQLPIMEHSSVPPEVRAILIAKCADCHSMRIRPRIYGRFAPVSWLMERDIVEGREAMNLALWDTYTGDQQRIFAAKIVQETKSHRMPLPQYRIAHWNSQVTDDEVQTFIQWMLTMPSFETVSVTQTPGEGDPARGKDIYERRCAGCHTMTQNREGPRLQGVYGRISGAVAGFDYSPALKKAHVVWDDVSLEQWLADPDVLVPGNNMDFHVAKVQERRDIIRFLKEGSNR